MYNLNAAFGNWKTERFGKVLVWLINVMECSFRIHHLGLRNLVFIKLFLRKKLELGYLERCHNHCFNFKLILVAYFFWGRLLIEFVLVHREKVRGCLSFKRILLSFFIWKQSKSSSMYQNIEGKNHVVFYFQTS
jgi:hypothetical protein